MIERPESAVGRRFVTLGAGEALARVIAFGASVYIARRLGASSFGILAFANAVLLYGTSLTDFGIEALGLRDVSAAPGRVPAIVPTLLAGRLLIAVSLIVVVGGGALLFLPSPDGAVLAACFLTLIPTALGTRWVLLGLDRPHAVAGARMLGELLMVALVLGMVRDPGDVVRVPLAQLIGDGAAALLLLALLRRGGERLALAWNPEVARSTARRAWPLVLHGLLGLVIFNADYVFLRALSGPAAVGLYAAGYTLISFLLNLGVSYGLSVLQSFARLETTPGDRQGLYDGALAHSFALTLPLAVGGSLLAPDIIHLVFGGEFADSVPTLRILLWVVPAALFRNVSQAALIAAGRQHAVLRTSGAAAAANIALNILLIPKYAMVGAAVATLLTETLRSVLAMRFAGETGLGTPNLARFWRSGLGVAVMVAALLAVRASLPLLVAIPAAAVVYGAVLMATGGLRFVGGRPQLTV